MSGIAQVEISHEMQYSDIIVPTSDSIRGSYLLDMLLTNRKQVSILFKMNCRAAKLVICQCMFVNEGWEKVEENGIERRNCSLTEFNREEKETQRER